MDKTDCDNKKTNLPKPNMAYLCSGGRYNLNGNSNLSMFCKKNFFDNMNDIKKKKLGCYNPNFLDRVKPPNYPKLYKLGEVPRGTFRTESINGNLPSEFVLFEENSNPWKSPYEDLKNDNYLPSYDVCNNIPNLS